VLASSIGSVIGAPDLTQQINFSHSPPFRTIELLAWPSSLVVHGQNPQKNQRFQLSVPNTDALIACAAPAAPPAPRFHALK